ncbi:MAG: nitroreductase family protein [Lentisphaerae bacterium]|nr:nitroreductase family protein [Lentisphaerota bacterium]
MPVLSAIRNRYSCRAYEDRPVEQEKLDAVLEAGRLAPSAKNMQEWRFVVVRDAATRRKLVPAANNQRFVGEAPVVIACCGTQYDYTMRCGHRACPIDVAIAIEHMALQAVAEGLATCWIGSFYEDRVKSVLGIPDAVRVIELLPLGYPADRPRPRQRVPIEDIVCYDRWTLPVS